MKTLEEIKKLYNDKVEERIVKEGLEISHSRYDVKDEVLSDLIEEEFDGELPKDKEVLKWFEKECSEVACYINTECF